MFRLQNSKIYSEVETSEIFDERDQESKIMREGGIV